MVDQNNTNALFQQIVGECKTTFTKKLNDYGPSWRVLRNQSILEQLWIKAKRIRTIQDAGKQLVDDIGDDIPSEFKGILNYAIIGLIQLKLPATLAPTDSHESILAEYSDVLLQAQQLMEKKNHDYGEAWRDMSLQGFVDFILTKILRLKQIFANNGEVTVSENADAIYKDIINYSVFALIIINETSNH